MLVPLENASRVTLIVVMPLLLVMGLLMNEMLNKDDAV